MRPATLLFLWFIGAATLLLSGQLAGQELAVAQVTMTDRDKESEESGESQKCDATAQGEDAPVQQTPIMTTVSLSADGGRDRVAIVDLRRGNWEFRSLNRVSPNGQAAFSTLLFGRRVKLSRRIAGAVLLGPWRSYENRAWDHLVLGTNVTLRGDRLQAAFLNYWAFPTASSGYFFDLHAQTFTGLPRLPKWLGVSLLQKHSKFGFERLFVGPLFTTSKGGVTFSACPYWDVQRERADLRLGISYTHTIRPR